MTGETPHTTRDPRAEHPCPACGKPRQVLAERHKVLGAWVPEWVVQPCRNPDCERYEPEGDPAADGGAAGGARRASGGDGPEPGPSTDPEPGAKPLPRT